MAYYKNKLKTIVQNNLNYKVHNFGHTLHSTPGRLCAETFDNIVPVYIAIAAPLDTSAVALIGLDTFSASIDLKVL